MEYIVNTIKQFMWSSQNSFYGKAQDSANRIFNKLDAKLQPQVFLVGILWKDVEDSGIPPIK